MSQVVAEQDVIVIDDLRVQAYVGVFDFERVAPQTLRFDIEIETGAGYAQRAIESDQYVSYADAVAFIEEKAASGDHVRLVEEWAEAVCAHILENKLVNRVTVTVTKTDIFDSAAGVGIRIVRKRS